MAPRIRPSFYEPFGYVVLEAMNYNIPIICSKNGGIAEIVGEYKYCFDPYIEDDLVQKIVQIQNDTEEELASQLSILQKRKYIFTAENMCKNYANFVAGVTGDLGSFGAELQIK